MLRSINSRAIIPVACTVTGFVIACCILLYAFVKDDLVNGEIQHASDLADTAIRSTRYTMLKGDRESLSHIVRSIGEQKQVEHIRIFNKKGLVMFSRDSGEVNQFVDKSAAGCNECHSGTEPKKSLGTMAKARQFINGEGKAVLAITAPIYNEPDCFNAACHFHDAGQSLLGTLDIGLSQAPLQRTLSQLKNRMIIFTGMVLVLTVGAVCALLYRQVFLPIQQLVAFTEAPSDDSLNEEFAAAASEIAQLAETYRTMASRIRGLEQKTQPAGDEDSTESQS
jgi:methyl-accepting chemotaxis protein